MPTTVPIAKSCTVCDDHCHPRAFLCRRCKKIRDRIDTRRGARVNARAREDAMRKAWDPIARVFRCAYSSAPLSEDPSSPWHVTFDHRTPRDESDLSICAAVINHMKTDLALDEFRVLVEQLAELFAGARDAVDAIHLRHWSRGAARNVLLDEK